MPVYDTPLTINDQSLDRVLRAGLPVALVLWDGHSGLPSGVDEALRQVAKAEVGRLLVARLDAANNPQAAAQWGSTLPALVLFEDGNVKAGPVALRDAETLRGYVSFLLGRGPQPESASATPRSSGADLTRPVTVTDATFQQEVFASPVPVVVDFWAPWCGPCRMIGPALERIAAEMGGRVKIAKVNVDENQRYAGQYGVSGIPTLLIVKDGKVVDRLVGALPEGALRQRISVYLR